MGKIYLARHGQDEDNAAEILNGRRDTNLTALGRTQAQALAYKIQDLGIDCIYTSPLRRAYDTGRICHEHLGLPRQALRVHPDLIERDFGVLTGQPKKDIPRYSRELLETRHTLFFLSAPYAEDFSKVRERASRVLADIQKLSYTKILLVCHGDVGNMVRAAFYGLSIREALTTYGSFMNCDVFELDEDTLGGCLI